MASRNVVSSKTCTHIWRTFVLLLLFVCQKYEAVEECSFLKSFANSRSFITELRKNGTSFDCGKFLNISGSSDYCMPKYYPSIHSHSHINHLSIGQFCVQNVSSHSDVNWSCIARHIVRLLTCLANVSSLISNNVHEDGIMKESCRKSLEFSECPSKVLLSACGEKSVEVVKGMIKFSFDYFMLSSCKDTSIKDVLEMPVNYYLQQDSMELAGCFDSHFVGIDACFQQLIQDEIDLQDFVCGRSKSLVDCVQFQVSRYCKLPLSPTKLLLKLFSFGGIRCKETQLTSPLSHTSVKDINGTSEIVHTSVKDINGTSEIVHTSVKDINGTSEIVLGKTYADDSLVKSHSENPSRKDLDQIKASKGTNLFCDKMIYCISFLFIILRYINQLFI